MLNHLKAGESRAPGLSEPNLISHCQFESKTSTPFFSLFLFLSSRPLLPPSSPRRQIDIPAADVVVVVHSNPAMRGVSCGSRTTEWMAKPSANKGCESLRCFWASIEALWLLGCGSALHNPAAAVAAAAAAATPLCSATYRSLLLLSAPNTRPNVGRLVLVAPL